MLTPSNPEVLNIDSLAQFRRNKPLSSYYGKGLPGQVDRTDDMFDHLSIIGEGDIEDRIISLQHDRNQAERAKDDTDFFESVGDIDHVIDTARTTLALIKLIERGTPSTARSVKDLILTKFITDNPYYCITATTAEEEGKPKDSTLYVAKLEAVRISPEFDSETATEVPLDIIVSDTDNNQGLMPRNTTNWQLGKLAMYRQ